MEGETYQQTLYLGDRIEMRNPASVRQRDQATAKSWRGIGAALGQIVRGCEAIRHALGLAR